jgi:hypothetical protein
LDLCTEPTTERGFRQPKSAKRNVDFIVVGSSNSLLTSQGLNRIGNSTVHVFIVLDGESPPNSVSEMATKLKETLAGNSPGAAVLQLIDNSLNYDRTEDGGSRPPKRGEDGKFHVLGVP